MRIGIRIEESWSRLGRIDGWRNDRRKLIHRSSFRASVLHLSEIQAVLQSIAGEHVSLDNAFVLIDGTRPWMGENHFAAWPVALYGMVLLFAGTAYYFLTKALIGHQGTDSTLADSVGDDAKGKLSIVVYLVRDSAVVRAAVDCLRVLRAGGGDVVVPDPRIEKALER